MEESLGDWSLPCSESKDEGGNTHDNGDDPEGLCTSRSNLLDIWVTWNHCWESRVRRIGGVGWDEESTCRLENLFNHDCGK